MFEKWQGRISLIVLWLVWVIFGILYSTGAPAVDAYPSHVTCPSSQPELCTSFVYGLMFAITSMSTAAQVSPNPSSNAALGIDSLYLFVGIPLYAGVPTVLF